MDGKSYKEGVSVTMKTRLQTFSIAALLFVILPTLLTPIAASALDEPAPRIGGHAENGNALVNGEYGDSESDPAGPLMVMIPLMIFLLSPMRQSRPLHLSPTRMPRPANECFSAKPLTAP